MRAKRARWAGEAASPDLDLADQVDAGLERVGAGGDVGIRVQVYEFEPVRDGGVFFGDLFLVDMHVVFVEDFPQLEGASLKYPCYLPSRLHPDGCGRNKTMCLVMKR